MQINPKAFIAYFHTALPQRFLAAGWQRPIHHRKGWPLAISFFLTAALLALVASGQTSPPNIPAIRLATDPLFAAVNGDKPAITLALSVEVPTVGAQYLAAPHATTDDTYTNAKEYLGYYDAESCYTYNNTPTETPLAGQTAADYKRFDRSGPASSRMCSNAFSGNFLNWASSSAIDMLRLSLTGGDRSIDTPNLTILQRAVLPNGGGGDCMWNSEYFPAKQLQRNGGGSNTYWGAIPMAMRTQATGNDVWVGNTLNRLYFGTQKIGNCENTSAYTLGTISVPRSLGPITNSPASSPPTDSIPCAAQGGSCDFLGTMEVWYGAASGWAVVPASNGALCSDTILGDPRPGVAKTCYYRPYTGSWVPPVISTVVALGPIIPNQSGSLPSGSVSCAAENGTCSFTGVKEVWYGAGSSWAVAPASNGTLCAYTVFGDPLPGVPKNCYYRDYSGTWSPPAPTSGAILSTDGFFYGRVQVSVLHVRSSQGETCPGKNGTGRIAATARTLHDTEELLPGIHHRCHRRSGGNSSIVLRLYSGDSSTVQNIFRR